MSKPQILAFNSDEKCPTQIPQYMLSVINRPITFSLLSSMDRTDSDEERMVPSRSPSPLSICSEFSISSEFSTSARPISVELGTATSPTPSIAEDAPAVVTMQPADAKVASSAAQSGSSDQVPAPPPPKETAEEGSTTSTKESRKRKLEDDAAFESPEKSAKKQK